MTDAATAKLYVGWRTVPFSKAVQNISERAEPAAEDSDLYVGLEHLDSGSLTVRRWGSERELEGTKLRMRKGDVLFAKRNAYLKRVAIAPHDGLFSAHGMVLRANPDLMLHEFLPFFMQSDHFWDRAIGISVGSLSPTINWTSLAKEEFALPPIEEQRRIAKVLRAADCATNALLELEASGAALLLSALAEEFSTKMSMRPLSDWCDQLITYGIVQAGPDTPGGVPYIRVSDMTEGRNLSPIGMLRTTPTIAGRFARSRVSAGDIVVALRGPVGLPRIVPPDLEGANLTQGTARVSVKRDCSRDYVYWALQSPHTLRQYASHAKGSTFSEISLEALRKIEVPVRAASDQRAIAMRVQAIDSAVQSVAARRQRASGAYGAFVNAMLRRDR